MTERRKRRVQQSESGRGCVVSQTIFIIENTLYHTCLTRSTHVCVRRALRCLDVRLRVPSGRERDMEGDAPLRRCFACLNQHSAAT